MLQLFKALRTSLILLFYFFKWTQFNYIHLSLSCILDPIMLKGNDLISPRHKWGLRSRTLKCFTHIFICRKEYWGCCCFETWQIFNVARILSENKVNISEDQSKSTSTDWDYSPVDSVSSHETYEKDPSVTSQQNSFQYQGCEDWAEVESKHNNLLRTPFPFHIIYNALHGHYYPQFRSSAEIADNSIRLVNKLQARKTLPFCRDSNEIRFICKQNRQSGWK